MDLRPARPIRHVGDISIDLTAHIVHVAGDPVTVTPTEFRLLAFLAQEPGRAFSADEILRHLWQTDYVGQESACRAHIFNLRQKIDPDPSQPRRIVTVRGMGYFLRG